jgi:hypothetical protein
MNDIKLLPPISLDSFTKIATVFPLFSAFWLIHTKLITDYVTLLCWQMFQSTGRRGSKHFHRCHADIKKYDNVEHSFNPQLSLQILCPLLGILLQSGTSGSWMWTAPCAVRYRKNIYKIRVCANSGECWSSASTRASVSSWNMDSDVH